MAMTRIGRVGLALIPVCSCPMRILRAPALLMQLEFYIWLTTRFSARICFEPCTSNLSRLNLPSGTDVGVLCIAIIR